MPFMSNSNTSFTIVVASCIIYYSVCVCSPFVGTSQMEPMTPREMVTDKCSHVPISWLLHEGKKINFIITINGFSFSPSWWIWSCLNILITSILGLIRMSYPLLIDHPIHSPHIDCWNWQGQFSLTWNLPLLQMQNQITFIFMNFDKLHMKLVVRAQTNTIFLYNSIVCQIFNCWIFMWSCSHHFAFPSRAMFTSTWSLLNGLNLNHI